jgi:hypothetical protein
MNAPEQRSVPAGKDHVGGTLALLAKPLSPESLLEGQSPHRNKEVSGDTLVGWVE